MFTGTVPFSWYKARALQKINTEGNFFSENVPIEIGLLRHLKGHSNFDNSITGKIPNKIDQMKFLGKCFSVNDTILAWSVLFLIMTLSTSS